MDNKSMNEFLNESGFQVLNPADTFKFECICCGNCCRHVKNSVMVESLDLFRIACHFKMDTKRIVNMYTDVVILSRGFPMLTLKSNYSLDTCIFMNSGKCSIHNVKPRACRLFPLTAGPDDKEQNNFISFFASEEHRHHFNGKEYKINDWLAENLTQDDREFVQLDYSFVKEFGKQIGQIDENNNARVVYLMLFYRFYNFDINQNFKSQFVRNMARLKNELKKLVVQNPNTR